MGENIQIHCKMVFEGVAGCVRERKKVQTKASTMISKMITKLITNRCEQMLETVMPKQWKQNVKVDPQRHPKSRKL